MGAKRPRWLRNRASGQNVNSYRDLSAGADAVSYHMVPSSSVAHRSRGFQTVYRPRTGGLRFADLLDR